MHLQIAFYAFQPRRIGLKYLPRSQSSKKPRADFGRLRNIRRILKPTANDPVERGTNAGKFFQRSIFTDDLRSFFRPEEGLARGPPKRLLQRLLGRLGGNGQKLSNIRVGQKVHRSINSSSLSFVPLL